MDRSSSQAPVALGFLALAAATICVSGLELGWLQAPGREVTAIVLVAFTAPLQLLVCVLALVRRDAIVGTGMGILAATWATVGVVALASPPGEGSSALGLFLTVAAGALAVPATAAARAGRLPAIVLGGASARLAVTGVADLIGGDGLRTAAGVAGLALGALAFTVAARMQVQ